MYPRSWKGSDIDLGCFQSLIGTAGRLAPGGGFRRTYFGVARLGVEPAGERDLVARVDAGARARGPGKSELDR